MKTAMMLAALIGLGTPALAMDDVAEETESDKALDAAEGPEGITESEAQRRCHPRACRTTRAAPGPRTAPRPPAVRTPPPHRVSVRPPGRVVVRPPAQVYRGPRVHGQPRVVTRRAPPRVQMRPPVVRRAPGPAPRSRLYVSGPNFTVRSQTVVVRRVHPWHGVFVYGPRPVHHQYYGRVAQPEVEEEHLPDRKVDRQGSFALGIKSGSYLSAYEGGSSYGDFGLGVVGRWRPEEALGLELAVTHHNETWNTSTERSQTLGQASAMLFANPWGRVQPYVLAGLSANARGLNDAVGTNDGGYLVQTSDLLWGPHAGAGIEFAFGERAALDLEARYVGWMNDREASLPGGLQTSANVVMHF